MLTLLFISASFPAAELEDEEGGFQAVTFRRGLHIYVLPDPHTLPVPAGGKVIQPCSLPLKSHWTAEVIDCCAVTTPRTDGAALGFLKVRVRAMQTRCGQLKDGHS